MSPERVQKPVGYVFSCSVFCYDAQRPTDILLAGLKLCISRYSCRLNVLCWLYAHAITCGCCDL